MRYVFKILYRCEKKQKTELGLIMSKKHVYIYIYIYIYDIQIDK